MKVVINACFGGFGLSDKAYEKLIEWGVPVRKYIDQEQDPVTGLYKPQPLNDGEVIFDRLLTPSSFSYNRYWDSWISDNRSHPLLIRVVEELGKDASNELADLKVVEIPDGTEYEIQEYDGNEHIAEKHRVWS